MGFKIAWRFKGLTLNLLTVSFRTFILGMFFLSQGLLQIRKSLSKSIQTKVFPYALNQVFSFEICSSIYKLGNITMARFLQVLTHLVTYHTDG